MRNYKLYGKRVIAVVMSVALGLSGTSGLSKAAEASEADSLEAAKKIYLDASQPTAERVKALMDVMTPDEKVAQMNQPEQADSALTTKIVKEKGIGSVLSGGGSAPSTGNTAADWENRVNELKQAAKESRLGIPLIYGVDGVHGNNNVDGSVIFPHNIGLGAADDEELTKQVGAAAAEEIRATGIQWTFAPTLGIVWNERWGRYYESFGEDAEKVSAQGAAYVEGFQGTTAQGEKMTVDKVAASAKHFIGEGQTTNGVNQGDVKLPVPDGSTTDQEFDKFMEENDLLKPYQATIAQGAKTVMVSYNSVNGMKCHANKHLLRDVLKGDLKFEGFVISDYNGIDQITEDVYEKFYNSSKDVYKAKVAAAIDAGVDMFMEPYNWQKFFTAAKDYWDLGEEQQAQINESVERILTVKFDMGLFEEEIGGAAEKQLMDKFGGEEHRAIAEKAVEKSMVLLKNDKQENGKTAMQVLDDAKKIAVAGYKANDIGAQCGGWTISWQGQTDESQGGIRVTKGTTIQEGFKEVAKKNDATVAYNARGNVSGQNAEAVVVVVGETPYAETNGDRRESELVLPSEDLTAIDKALETAGDAPVIVVLLTGRPVAVADFIDDVDAVVEAWLPGTEGNGIAEVMLDNSKDFNGKLPVTWAWYPEYISTKLAEKDKVLFPAGTGLKKAETAQLSAKPAEPPKEEEAVVKTRKGGVDVDTYNGKLEAEFCRPDSGDLNSYNITREKESEGDELIGFVNFDSKAWANPKWIAYFRQAGDYKVIARIKVTKSSNNLVFGFGKEITGDGPNTNVNVSVGDKSDTYKTIDIGTVTVDAPGLFGVKMMDNSDSGTLGMHLDYLQFDLVEGTAKGDKDTANDADEAPVNPADETVKDSKGEVIAKDAVKVYMSSSENSQSMTWYKRPYDIKNTVTEKKSLDITKPDDQKMTEITVNPDQKYQTLLGIGTSLEESTVNNLAQLDPKVKEEFLRKLVDPKQGGMTLFRLTIGTADFTSQPFYTYYDARTLDETNAIKNADGTFSPDWYNTTGKGFSIQKDIDLGVVDTIKQVQALAKEYGVEDEVKFFASSWTPPGWMKAETNESKSRKNNELLLKSGSLKDEYVNDLAMYYTRFLEEYAKLGIPVYAMTLQNEPKLEVDYPSCLISGKQEGLLAIEIKKDLSASTILKENGINDVKLWAFDHNCNIAEDYVKDLMSVEGVNAALDGIAFHDYGGDLKTMQDIYDTYLNQPGSGRTDQTVGLTERSVWGTKGANSIVTYLRNNAISYNSWVTMLDSNIAVHQWPGTPDPTMFVRAAGSDTDYWATPEFYITGQFSRFIRPGYVRVQSSEGSTASDVTNVVFQDPKTGKLVAVVVNDTEAKQDFKIICNGQQIIGSLPAKNVATYVWGDEGTVAPPIPTTPTKVSSKKVTLNTKKLYIVKGKSVTIKGVMEPAKTTDKITWSTSKKSVATVKNGKITAKKAGLATITAKTTSGKKAICKVTVVKKAAKSTSIKLKSKATVKKGAWILLTPTLKPAKTTDAVKWKSSKKSVASVDAYGFVTGKKKGTTKITATTSSGKKVTCTVTVK